jgi:transposase-like protein
MKKQRKHYTPEEKVATLRRHLVEGVPISDLCDELGLQPTVFLPLAEGVLRERSRGFSAARTDQPSGRTGTHRPSGKEDPDEG